LLAVDAATGHVPIRRRPAAQQTRCNIEVCKLAKKIKIKGKTRLWYSLISKLQERTIKVDVGTILLLLL
jgi:hypothetical protein